MNIKEYVRKDGVKVKSHSRRDYSGLKMAFDVCLFFGITHFSYQVFLSFSGINLFILVVFLLILEARR